MHRHDKGPLGVKRQENEEPSSLRQRMSCLPALGRSAVRWPWTYRLCGSTLCKALRMTRVTQTGPLSALKEHRKVVNN